MTCSRSVTFDRFRHRSSNLPASFDRSGSNELGGETAHEGDDHLMTGDRVARKRPPNDCASPLVKRVSEGRSLP
jgi:hypothetical protein